MLPKHIVALQGFEDREFSFRRTNVGVIGQLLVAPVRLRDVVFLAKLLCIAQIAGSDGHDLTEQQNTSVTAPH